MESINIFTEKQICIVGTGGFAREVYCCLEDIFNFKGVSFENRAVFSDVDSCEKSFVLMGENSIPIIRKNSRNILNIICNYNTLEKCLYVVLIEIFFIRLWFQLM